MQLSAERSAPVTRTDHYEELRLVYENCDEVFVLSNSIQYNMNYEVFGSSYTVRNVLRNRLSKTPIYRAPIYCKPRCTAAISFPPNSTKHT